MATAADKVSIIRNLLRDGVTSFSVVLEINGERYPWLNSLAGPDIAEKLPNTLRRAMALLAAEALVEVDNKIVTVSAELDALRALRRQLS